MTAGFFRTERAAGFTLLELVIVLGISGLIFGGLWGLISSGGAQLQAQTAAQQYRQVIEASRRLLAPGIAQGAFNPGAFPPGSHDGLTPGGAQDLPISTLTDPAVGLLSPNFAQASGGNYFDAFGHQIKVAAQRMDDGTTKWRFVVYSTPANGAPLISDKIGAQIASLIGSEGGFIYSVSTEGCSNAGNFSVITCGSFNAFAFNLTGFGTVNPSPGRIATLSFTSDSSTVGAPWLMRLQSPAGPVRFNTMYYDLDFDTASNATLGRTPALRMNGNTVSLGTAVDSTAGGGIFNGAGGKIIMGGGTISMGADAATTGGGVLYMGNSDIRDIANITGDSTTGTFKDLTLSAIPGNIRMITDAGLLMYWKGLVGDPRRTDPNAVLLDIAGTGHAEIFQAAQFIYTTGGSPSDIRLKVNVRPMTNALPKILQLQGMDYNWRSSDRKDIGLVAQDVKKVFPEVVVDVGQGRLGIDYAKLVAPLIEAVRELKEQNDVLKRKVDALQERLPAP